MGAGNYLVDGDDGSHPMSSSFDKKQEEDLSCIICENIPMADDNNKLNSVHCHICDNCIKEFEDSPRELFWQIVQKILPPHEIREKLTEEIFTLIIKNK